MPRLKAISLTLAFLSLLSACDKTAENTNKPVIIQGWTFTVDGDSVTPAGTLQLAPGQVLTIKVNFTDPDAGNNPDPSWYSFTWAVERLQSGASFFNPNENFIVNNENPCIWAAPNVTGFYRFIVEVRDRYQTPSMESVVVEVSSNKPPVITGVNISNASPFVNEEITIRVEATDPDGNLPLEYVWQATGGYFTAENNGTAKWVSASSGTFQITVSVNDQAGGSTSRTLPVTVQANHPPVIEGWELSPGNSVAPNTLVTITLTASDEDGDQLEYNWSADKGTFNTVNKYVAIWRAPGTSGSCTVTVVVEDNKGGSDTANIVINVV